MTRLVLVAIVVTAVVGIGVTIWINGSGPPPSATDRHFFAASEEYPTSSGQGMQPRWNAGEEATDAPEN